jgi:hypothetical protein
MESRRGKRKAAQIAEEDLVDDDNEEYKESVSRHKADDKDGRDKGSGSASRSALLLPPEDEGDDRGHNVSSACRGGGDGGGDGGGEYSGGGADFGAGAGDAGGGDGGGGSGRGRRQRGTRGVNYVEPSEDDIYRRPRGVSYSEPSEDGKRACREHVSLSNHHHNSCCGYCGDQFPQEQGVRKVTWP